MPGTKPLVIVPTYKHPEFTERLKKSLEPYEDQMVLRIVSDDEGPGLLNLGYVKRVNWAVEQFWKGDEHILLLNYDTDLTHSRADWLEWMVTEMESRHKTDHAAMVGPLMNYVMGTQHPPTNAEDRPVFVAREIPGSASCPMAMLSGACLLLHKTFVIERLNLCHDLLSPKLNRLSYDDNELSFWARERGWTLWKHQGVFVWHEPDRDERAGDETPEGLAAIKELYPDRDERCRPWIDLRFSG